MRKVATLITEVRRQTDNEDFSATTGITDNEILQYFNDAADDLHVLVASEAPSLLETTEEISLVASTRSYALDTDNYLFSSVTLVEYSYDGDSKHYVPMEHRSLRELENDESSRSYDYNIQNGKILISPVPSASTGKVRVTYLQRFSRLDIPRGTATAPITSTTLTVASPDAAIDDAEYVCAVNFLGEIEQSILINSWVSPTITSTGIDTVKVSSGDYVVVGQFSSTHLVMPGAANHLLIDREAERYLKAYVAAQVSYRDDFIAEGDRHMARFHRYEEAIARMLNDIDVKVETIPIINDFWT